MRSPVVVAALFALCGCRVQSEALRTTTWGSMSEVMRQGRTEGRISLQSVLTSREMVGIGALEGLCGEIAILDGEAWTARNEGGLVCERGARADDRATLLVISDVDEWHTTALDSDTDYAAFECALADLAASCGLDGRPAWPFVVEGELRRVETHVLNGQCPFSGPVDPEHEPIRRSFEAVRAKLIGYYAPASDGRLVHRGQATHAHLLVEEPAIYVGHVDSFELAAGTVLHVPVAR